MTDFSQRLVCRLAIAKVPLCLLVAFSAVFGFLYANPLLISKTIQVFFSVLFLACGAATLNSVQERSHDGLMQRTRNRPLVKGRISAKGAVIQAIMLITAGLGILIVTTNFKAFVAGALAIIFYNGFYTRLKSKSLFAIVPGTISGAIPPYLGWLASGAEVISFRAILPVVLLIFWQIPHFFLVLLNHKSDYQLSVFPNLLKELTEDSIKRIFLTWITALAVTMLTFTILPSYMSNFERLMIVVNACVLLGVFFVHLLYGERPSYTYLFRHLNLSIFIIMLVVCVSAVTH